MKSAARLELNLYPIGPKVNAGWRRFGKFADHGKIYIGYQKWRALMNRFSLCRIREVLKSVCAATLVERRSTVAGSSNTNDVCTSPIGWS